MTPRSAARRRLSSGGAALTPSPGRASESVQASPSSRCALPRVTHATAIWRARVLALPHARECAHLAMRLCRASAVDSQRCEFLLARACTHESRRARPRCLASHSERTREVALIAGGHEAPRRGPRCPRTREQPAFEPPRELLRAVDCAQRRRRPGGPSHDRVRKCDARVLTTRECCASRCARCDRRCQTSGRRERPSNAQYITQHRDLWQALTKATR